MVPQVLKREIPKKANYGGTISVLIVPSERRAWGAMKQIPKIELKKEVEK